MEKIILTSYSEEDIRKFFREELISVLKEQSITAPVEPAVKDDERFDIESLATYLKISKVTVWRYKSTGAIPFHQTGRTVYFIKSEIDNYLASNQKPIKR